MCGLLRFHAGRHGLSTDVFDSDLDALTALELELEQGPLRDGDPLASDDHLVVTDVLHGAGDDVLLIRRLAVGSGDTEGKEASVGAPGGDDVDGLTGLKLRPSQGARVQPDLDAAEQPDALYGWLRRAGDANDAGGNVVGFDGAGYAGGAQLRVVQRGHRLRVVVLGGLFQVAPEDQQEVLLLRRLLADTRHEVQFVRLVFQDAHGPGVAVAHRREDVTGDGLPPAEHLHDLVGALVGLVEQELGLAAVVEGKPDAGVLAGELDAVEGAVGKGVLGGVHSAAGGAEDSESDGGGDRQGTEPADVEGKAWLVTQTHVLGPRPELLPGRGLGGGGGAGGGGPGEG